MFETIRDFEEFLWLIAWAKLDANIRIIAYCLMTNHWHFIVWPLTNDAVTRFLHRLETTHAIRRRLLTCTVGHGHIYQDRYRASVIDSERYYWTCLRYVEANALRAGLVKTAEKWKWSSLYERLGQPRGILDDGPFAMPAKWPELVNQSLPDATLMEIRKALWKQRRICDVPGTPRR